MKSDKLFFQIAKKKVWSHFRELWIVVLCETILTAISYSIACGYQMFSNSHTSEFFMQEDGISKSFVSAGMILLFCGIILIITVLVSYLGKRIPEYIQLQRMGITKKDLQKIILFEAIITYFVSIGGGFLVGKLLSTGLKNLIKNVLNITFKLGKISIVTYPLICMFVLFIYGIGFLLVKELESDFLIITNTNETARTEKLEGKFKIPKIILGVLFCFYSMYSYSQIYHYENAFLIIIFFAGFYMVIKNVVSTLLIYIKKNNFKWYYNHLLKNNRFYYRLNTVTRYVLFFSVMSFLGCFYFGFQLISIVNSEKVEDLYPYDFMCIADNSDDAFFEEIKEKYHINLIEYPMVRVANADKTERTEGRGEDSIQGQQIGISETTYHELKQLVDPLYKRKQLKLDKSGEKVYIVHQQDRATKAQPLDWYYNKKAPNLHIGVPCICCDFGDRETAYIEKEIVGEEISSLTGCYSTPKCENLIVFSDEYFIHAQNEWKEIDAVTGYKLERYKMIYGGEGEPTIIEGPTKLILIRVDEKYVNQIDRELEEKEKNHNYIGNYDSTVKFHYSSKIAIKDMQTERAVKMMICIYIMITLCVLNWIMLYAMYLMEYKEKREREIFLLSMGMTKKERKKMNQREWYIFFIIPASVLVISTIIFMKSVLAARIYSDVMRKICVVQEAKLVVVWILINGIFFLIMDKIMQKRMKREMRENE